MAVAVIVCGGRGFNDRAKIFETLDHIYERRGISKVIHGDCSGVDKIAGEWAKAMGVQVLRCPPDWSLGKAAGPIRNRFMLTLKPDGVIAFPGGAGTADMKAQAKKAGVPVMEIQP